MEGLSAEPQLAHISNIPQIYEILMVKKYWKDTCCWYTLKLLQNRCNSNVYEHDMYSEDMVKLVWSLHLPSIMSMVFGSFQHHKLPNNKLKYLSLYQKLFIYLQIRFHKLPFCWPSCCVVVTNSRVHQKDNGGLSQLNHTQTCLRPLDSSARSRVHFLITTPKHTVCTKRNAKCLITRVILKMTMSNGLDCHLSVGWILYFFKHCIILFSVGLQGCPWKKKSQTQYVMRTSCILWFT